MENVRATRRKHLFDMDVLITYSTTLYIAISQKLEEMDDRIKRGKYNSQRKTIAGSQNTGRKKGEEKKKKLTKNSILKIKRR